MDSVSGITPQYLTLDIDEQIENWVAWTRSRPGRGGHCASIEKWYRPPKHWHPDPNRMAVDINAAMSVERAMNDVPIQHRTALILHYAWLSSSSYICRKLGLRQAAWLQFLSDAKAMLTNVLLKSGKWRIQSS